MQSLAFDDVMCVACDWIGRRQMLALVESGMSHYT